MNLLVKEIDKYQSKKFKNKIIKEYIIYLMIDEIPIMAFLEIGETAKNIRIIELLSKYYINNKNLNNI